MIIGDFMKYIDKLQNDKKKIPLYANHINDILEDAIKKEEELQEWRNASGCKTLHNFKQKRSNESILLLENQQWKDAACCGSPGALQKKMTKYQEQDQQIHNWMNMLNIRTVSAFNNRINELINKEAGDLKSFIEDPEMRTYDIYKKWVKSEGLFKIQKTYVSLYTVFKDQKDKLINAVERGERDLTQYNTWYIADFFVYACDKELDVDEVSFFKLNEAIDSLRKAKNNFDPYDKNDVWYRKQTEELKEVIRNRMEA